MLSAFTWFRATCSSRKMTTNLFSLCQKWTEKVTSGFFSPQFFFPCFRQARIVCLKLVQCWDCFLSLCSMSFSKMKKKLLPCSSGSVASNAAGARLATLILKECFEGYSIWKGHASMYSTVTQRTSLVERSSKVKHTYKIYQKQKWKLCWSPWTNNWWTHLWWSEACIGNLIPF